MQKFATVDFEKQKSFRTEIEKYVQQLHVQLGSIEQKRYTDQQAHIRIIEKLKQDNNGFKGQLRDLETQQENVKIQVVQGYKARSQSKNEKINKQIKDFENGFKRKVMDSITMEASGELPLPDIDTNPHNLVPKQHTDSRNAINILNFDTQPMKSKFEQEQEQSNSVTHGATD